MLLGMKFVWPEAVNLSVCYNPQLLSYCCSIYPANHVSLLLITFLLSELTAMVTYCSSGALIYTPANSCGGYLRAGLLCPSARHYPVRWWYIINKHLKAGQCP